MITSRYNQKIYFYLLTATAASFLISLFLLQLFAGLLTILWLSESFENKKKAVDIFTWLIVIFGLIRILSIFFSQYPADSYRSFYKDALFYFSFFSISYYLKVIDYKKLKSILSYFSVAAIVVALIGLVLFNINSVERAQSFSSGYSTFSSYLIAALGIMIAVPAEIKIKKSDSFWAAGIAIVLAGVITSLGRTNMFIAGMIMLAGIIFKKLNVKNILLIILLTTILSSISFYNNRTEVEQRVENPTTLSDRDVLMKGVEALKFDHPIIGFGPRTFHQIFPYKKEFTDKGIGSWHNDFIQVYFESGLLGLLSFLSIIVFVVFYCFKFLKGKDKSNYFYNIVLGTLFAFSALVLSALTAGFIDSPVLSIVFAFLISMLSASIYHSKKISEV